MHDWNGGAGWGAGAWVMMVMMATFVVLCVGLVVWLVRQSSQQGAAPAQLSAPPGGDARRILDERFARGEIDEAEYRARRELLSAT